MSEHDRVASQPGPTNVGSGVDAERETVAREIGATLARAREGQRLTIEDVSARLKVPATKLSAIESGQVGALPDITFAKGVMRAYARVIHADIDALLARFQPQPVAAIEAARPYAGQLNEAFDDRKRFAARGSSGGSGGRLVWLALVVAVIGAGGWFGYDHARQWFAERHPAEQAGKDTAATVQVSAGTTTENGTVTAALPPVMNAPDAPAPSEAEPASAPAAPATQAAAPAATVATPAPAVAAAATATATAATAAAAAPATTPAAAPVAQASAAAAAPSGEIQIRFAADTWYEIRDRNGKVVMGGTAKAGQEVSGGGAAPYKVVIGNVKGIAAMTRNGEPVDLKSADRSNVARMTLP